MPGLPTPATFLCTFFFARCIAIITRTPIISKGSTNELNGLATRTIHNWTPETWTRTCQIIYALAIPKKQMLWIKILLITIGVIIHLKLISNRVAITTIMMLAIDTITASILTPTLPNNNKIAIWVHRCGRKTLIIGNVYIHLKLSPQLSLIHSCHGHCPLFLSKMAIKVHSCKSLLCLLVELMNDALWRWQMTEMSIHPTQERDDWESVNCMHLLSQHHVPPIWQAVAAPHEMSCDDEEGLLLSKLPWPSCRGQSHSFLHHSPPQCHGTNAIDWVQ